MLMMRPTKRLPRRRRLAAAAGLGGALLLLAASTVAGQPPQAGQSGIYEQMRRLLNVRHNSGQNVHPVFEGWERNPDGTASLYWGYMNRNWAEFLSVRTTTFRPAPRIRGSRRTSCRGG